MSVNTYILNYFQFGKASYIILEHVSCVCVCVCVSWVICEEREGSRVGEKVGRDRAGRALSTLHGHQPRIHAFLAQEPVPPHPMCTGMYSSSVWHV